MGDKPKAKFLTAKPAGQFLSATASYARFLGDTGKLRCTRTSSGVRLFKLGDLERFAAEREQKRREAEAAK